MQRTTCFFHFQRYGRAGQVPKDHGHSCSGKRSYGQKKAAARCETTYPKRLPQCHDRRCLHSKSSTENPGRIFYRPCAGWWIAKPILAHSGAPGSSFPVCLFFHRETAPRVVKTRRSLKIFAQKFACHGLCFRPLQRPARVASAYGSLTTGCRGRRRSTAYTTGPASASSVPAATAGTCGVTRS